MRSSFEGGGCGFLSFFGGGGGGGGGGLEGDGETRLGKMVGLGWDGMGRRVIFKRLDGVFDSPPTVLLSRLCGAKSELAARERSKREDWREQWRW